MPTLHSINNDIVRRAKLIEFNEVRKSHNVLKFGYDNRFGDLRAAVNYASEIADLGFSENTPGESFVLYREQIRFMREFIKKNKPTKVFNFGICYAHVDAILAEEFPGVNFAGTDLTQYNKAFNECEFSHVSNLKILTGDVFKEFTGGKYGGGVLFHSRTLVLLPKEFIERLYKAAYEAGFSWVVGFEQHGLSEETQEPFTFDREDRLSVYWRDRMFIHNYLGLAENAGFRIIEASNFSTGHTSPDYKVLRFAAERK